MCTAEYPLNEFNSKGVCMLTNSLTGVELDLWVAKIEEKQFAISDVYRNGTRSVIMYFSRNDAGFLDGRSYTPSTHESDGFPLILKYRISLKAPKKNAQIPVWAAKMDGPGLVAGSRAGTITCEALYPLMAAMRCLVTHHYGAEVPDGELERLIEQTADMCHEDF